MAKQSYLKRRGNRFYFRRRVPSHLAHKLGKSELMIALNTDDLSLARTRCYRLAARVEELILMADTLTDGEIQELAQHAFKDELVAGERVLAQGGRPAIDDLEHLRSCLRLGERHPVVDSKLQSIAVNVDPASERLLARYLTRAAIELQSTLKARYDGDYSYCPSDPVFSPCMDWPSSEGPQEGARAAPVVMQEPSKSLSACIEEYLVGNHSRQVKATLRMFFELHGDLPVSTVGRKHLTAYRDALRELPPTHAKVSPYKELSLPDKLAIAEDAYDGPVVADKTIKRQFSELSGLFQWCIDREYMESNPTRDFRWPRGESARNQWEEFSGDDLRVLFASPVWTGAANERHRNTEGGTVYKDWQYWIPLVALYSGMRLNEICQLTTGDIKSRDDVSYFDINDDGGNKRLKNAESKRLVPVHSHLKELGFLAFVSEREQGNLWGLAISDAGYFSEAPRRAFANTLDACGVKRDKLSFRSFRRTFASALQNGSVPEAAAASLMGHTFESMSYGRYSRGLDNLTVLQEALEQAVLERVCLTTA